MKKIRIFMGTIPEFYVCRTCAQAFDLETLKPVASAR